ncbi:MBL fold metallo-hydrolase [Clostridium sp. D43t1_170807_H7]|uniref:ComEC/Rec2 family competence protein n=1 Tax=Clostridium sp. D43t1_170807_H7 TaxID=2787140 RepID=UPI00189C4FA0|nr:MBL fold metallo-hydrolase [Clostridium sp. D43t1_170807_H7]
MYKKGIIFLVLSLLVIFQFIINIMEERRSNISTYIESSDDKIHFIAIGSSDAILIESNGNFALVDAGEDTGTSKENGTQEQLDELNTKGYEEVVVNYLKDMGVETLEFVIATHAHSDHIGNMDTIFESFEVKKLYTREYKQTFIDDYGNKQQLFTLDKEYYWDNKEVFKDMITSAENKNIPITYVDEGSNEEELNLKLEDFKIQIVNNNLYNTEKQREYKIIPSENNNSLGVIVSKGEKRAFLAGDIGNEDGDEDYLISDPVTKDLLKDIDVLKIGHHGMNGSYGFISYLNPKITIVTGGEYFSPGGQGYESLKSINAKNVYTTNENSNIIISFNDDGTISNNAKIDNFNKNFWEKIFKYDKRRG